jgi:arylsulfatase A-like enzyme
MAEPLNVVLLIADGHGYHTGDLDWGTEEYRGLRSRLERLRLEERGFAKFTNVVSPAVSTIMSIESMLTGLYAAKTHKLHWREWPEWDRLEHPQFSTFLQARGYAVNGFSYLLNAENWMPGIHCYKPELYRDFPSHKRDTHSHHAVLAAVKHYFAHDGQQSRPQCLLIHSIFVYDFWDELMDLCERHGLTAANTIFAFTSDHYFPKNFGRQWLLGERDGWSIWHHTDLTEDNTRVFLYLKYPGLQPRVVGDVVAGYDVAPTLLELLGLRGEWPARCDGESVLPLLAGAGGTEGRVVRNDNVYPFQIGEKQGRISAVRFGRFKYVFRPDPVSSYISYRMHEPWGCVLGPEELYDIAADPEEQRNLVGSTDPTAEAALERGRAELRRTSGEILEFHAEHLRKFAERTGLAARLRPGAGPPARVLCFQSCPPEVAVTLVRMLGGLWPAAQIDLVTRETGGLALPGRVRAVSEPTGAYDCGLRLSNFPVGAYAGVYDPGVHPVGDFAEAGRVLRALAVPAKFTLALDGSLTALGHSDQPAGDGVWARCRQAARRAAAGAVEGLKPKLRRWLRSVESGGAGIPQHLAERIIRKDRAE